MPPHAHANPCLTVPSTPSDWLQFLADEREAQAVEMTAGEFRPDAIERTRAELAHVPALYRPIKSAPEDGSPVLVHCYWEPLSVVGKFKDGSWVVAWDETSLSQGYEATHWTYLPEDPRNTDQARDNWAGGGPLDQSQARARYIALRAPMATARVMQLVGCARPCGRSECKCVVSGIAVALDEFHEGSQEDVDSNVSNQVACNG